MRRVILCKNGSTQNRKVISLTTFPQLLAAASVKFNFDAKRIFTAEGGEVDNIEVLQDNELLTVTAGEDFIKEDESSDHGKNSKSDWIILNVRGVVFVTSRATLVMKEPNSTLAKMFCCNNSGLVPSEKDSSGAYLLDRSPMYFVPILNYLEASQIIISTDVNPIGVLEEARYFNIESMIPQLETIATKYAACKDTTPLCTRDNSDLVEEEDTNADNKYLRRDFYCDWANSKAIDIMFNDIVERMKNFFANHVILVTNSTEDERDILFSFVEMANPKPHLNNFEVLNVRPSEIKIFDHCLNQAILMSEDNLVACKRNAASSSVKTIGYQHIHRHNIIETDASDSSINDLFSSTSEDLFDEDDLQEPKKKKQKMWYKTCQLKIHSDCDDLSLMHDDNFTKLSGAQTKLEILILCPRNSETMCRKIASHLGLIFIEDMFRKIEKNAKNEKLSNDVNQKGSKLYPLFQNYAARSMMLGCSNISLTCNVAIFKNMNSNVKCMIFKEVNTVRKLAEPLINMHVIIKNDTFMDYLCAISEIIDMSLKFKVSIPAIYRMSDKFYNCDVSAVGIVPLYILKFFAAKKLAERNMKESLF